MNINSSPFAIVIPCFRDAENIPFVVAGLNKYIPHAKIIIVDDSPSSEQKKLQQFAAKHKDLTVMFRTGKLGRGNAVLAGLKKALEDKNITHIFEMDADTSHDPHDIKKFLPLTKKADVVIGSRYVRGSNIENWPKQRIFFSSLINGLFLRLLLNLPLHDYTNGYRMYNRRAAEFLLKTPMKQSGFLLLSETAFVLHHAGFILTEVPITFTDRKYGKSSVGIQELLSSLMGAFTIRFFHEKDR